MGLTSNGGVHSSLVHLFKLCDIAKEYNINNTFIPVSYTHLDVYKRQQPHWVLLLLSIRQIQ